MRISDWSSDVCSSDLRYVWETTVAEERATNIHLHDGIEEDAFVAMRNERDKTLQMPVLILPSVQVNMRGGELPPAENNGVRYLKIPVDALDRKSTRLNSSH